MSPSSGSDDAAAVYTYLGPAGTFTEAALLRIPGAADAERVPSTSVNSALEKVRSGGVTAAMVPIENSVEGGVSATLDAIATGGALQIVAEVLVPITFVLVVRDGITELGQIRTVATHGHAWAQCRGWAEENIPRAEFVPASSTAAGALSLLEPDAAYDASICSPLVAEENPLAVLRSGIEDNAGAVTRFVLVGRPGSLPPATGSDKTTVVIPLPEDHPGALMEILEQFAARGVNLSRIESRPTGQKMGDYFFSVDAHGHVDEARMADALAGLHRISPAIRFLGSYPSAEQSEVSRPSVARHNTDEAFAQAHAWVRGLRGGS
ncbi:prephenate dehydratase [Zafaria sp. J156]|uniref:prephenate dehydratase n=1 Tax=Zafaria sp. J156 TaxID=3116490 RepID=UPI002E78608E|nr:prephenate dehydratase [Zafaria sp. J156]MEE1621420.1 prephenate dehydratase [Zafaria sp. J156]